MTTRSPAAKIIERAFKEDVEAGILLQAYTDHCAHQRNELARINAILRDIHHGGEYVAGVAKGKELQAQAVKDLRAEMEALRQALAKVRAAPTLAEAVSIANAMLLTEAQAVKIGRGLLHE